MAPGQAGSMRVVIRRDLVQRQVSWARLLSRFEAAYAPPADTGVLQALRRAAGPPEERVNLQRLPSLAPGWAPRLTTCVHDLRDEVQQAGATPLVTLMGRTRGWRHATRLKLYLTLLWWQQSRRPLLLDRNGIRELAEYASVERRAVN